VAGAPLQVSWTVSNHGNEASEGAWTDAVYLSRDTVWDVGDRLLGKFDHNGTLLPGQSYRGRATPARCRRRCRRSPTASTA